MTGATGNMGFAGFKELFARRDRFNIRLLARKSEKNQKLLENYLNDGAVEVIWGDMMSFDDVLKGVTGADYVLHIGGMVSPAADYYPEKTLKVNVGSSEIIARAVLAQPDPSAVKVVYIGSVAQLGDRLFPHHWGRAGDPVQASPFDMYSLSKCRAEKAIVDSGVPCWVSLRQSGILYPDLLKAMGPTAFHVPVAGVLEWTTIEDSGRLLANVCEDWVPDSFWNNFYNIGSGPEYRMSNYEFESRIIGSLGLGGPEKVFEPQWFALKNFHGMWYEDSDRLENILHFRENLPLNEYFRRLKKELPWFYSLAPLAPKSIVKKFLGKYAYDKVLGTQYWVENDPARMEAFYGSREAYESIRSWNDVRPPHYETDAEKARASKTADTPERVHAAHEASPRRFLDNDRLDVDDDVDAAHRRAEDQQQKVAADRRWQHHWQRQHHVEHALDEPRRLCNEISGKHAKEKDDDGADSRDTERIPQRVKIHSDSEGVSKNCQRARTAGLFTLRRVIFP